MYHIAYLIVRFVNLLQLNPDRVFPRLVHGDEADSVGGKVRMTILIIGDLIFATVQSACDALQSSKKEDKTYPSYNPTASWTKSRVSSGNSEGRKAVVRSRALRNI